jgi:hypothetical protein
MWRYSHPAIAQKAAKTGSRPSRFAQFFFRKRNFSRHVDPVPVISTKQCRQKLK